MSRCPDCGAENLPGEEDCASCRTPIAGLDPPRSKPGGPMRRRILEGTVRDLKPRDAMALGPDKTVAEAVTLMRGRKTGCILVTDGKGLAGIFTERDLLRKVAGLKDPSKVRLSDVMQTEVQTLAEDEALAHAFHHMAVKGYHHLPVVRKDGGYGIVSSRDLLRYLCK